jgi:hypothetical protein
MIRVTIEMFVVKAVLLAAVLVPAGIVLLQPAWLHDIEALNGRWPWMWSVVMAPAQALVMWWPLPRLSNETAPRRSFWPWLLGSCLVMAAMTLASAASFHVLLLSLSSLTRWHAAAGLVIALALAAWCLWSIVLLRMMRLPLLFDQGARLCFGLFLHDGIVRLLPEPETRDESIFPPRRTHRFHLIWATIGFAAMLLPFAPLFVYFAIKRWRRLRLRRRYRRRAVMAGARRGGL